MLFKNAITIWHEAGLGLLWLPRRCWLDVKATWCCWCLVNC